MTVGLLALFAVGWAMINGLTLTSVENRGDVPVRISVATRHGPLFKADVPPRRTVFRLGFVNTDSDIAVACQTDGALSKETRGGYVTHGPGYRITAVVRSCDDIDWNQGSMVL